jgi:SAM-dependent methyltransferase
MYDSTFFDYIQQGAKRSADVVTNQVLRLLRVDSVLDVGCGRGTWLAQWKTRGVSDILGVDGSYVSAESLVIPLQNFRSADLCQPLDLGRRFDLVQSLEVAEHLPPAAADTLVSTLTGHGDIVMFSAARPGQGGENHLNERPYEYWRQLFRLRGYEMYDAVRPMINEPQVEPWYRYNTFLFVSEIAAPTLPTAVRTTRIEDHVAVADVSPWVWRARCAALRATPAWFVHRLALAKHHAALGWRAVTSHRHM